MLVTSTRIFGSTAFENTLVLRCFRVVTGKNVKCLTKRHTYDLFPSRIGGSMDLQVQ